MSLEDQKDGEREVMLYVQTNNLKDPAPYELLMMFYKGCDENTVGLMEALDEETGETDYLIVGLVEDPETKSVKSIPLARVFKGPEETYKYIAPDGKGNYYKDEVKEDEHQEATIN